MPLHVLIVGGGIGGLCLAQGLRKAGVSVAVYERDSSAHSRSQGYRFRIDLTGDAALRQCLPSNLYELYLATSDKPTGLPVAGSDDQFDAIFRMDRGGLGFMPRRAHIAVNRVTLRQVLLGDLGHIVHFGHTFVKVEQSDGSVRANFANGKTAVGDVLIAADGINSVVRHHILPHAEVYDTALRCIYGKTLLDTQMLDKIPEGLFNQGSTPVLGPDGRALAPSSLRPRRPVGLALSILRPRRPIEEAVNEFAPGLRLDSVQDYITWIVVAALECYQIADQKLAKADAPTLYRVALDMTKDWHPDLRQLLELADVPATSLVPVCTSRPVPPWPTGNITLLGDAIHAMTPAGGAGANIALRDAALLTRQLAAAAQGELELLTAIEQYENQMRNYGFAAVEKSLRKAERWYRLFH